MRYIVVQGKSRYDLEKQVEQWLKLGYKPIGSVDVQISHGLFSYLDDDKYTQAMIKEET